MSYFILIAITIASIFRGKYLKSNNIDELRFINLIFLILSIWSIQRLIIPDSCKCESDSLMISSLFALLFIYLLNLINKIIKKS